MAVVDFSRFASVLRELGVAGEVRVLPESAPTAAAAAAQLGCEVGAIANSLVFDADGAPLLVMTSGAHRVDTVAGRAAGRRLGGGQGRCPVGAGVDGAGDRRRRAGRAPAPVRTLVDVWLAKYDVVWAAAGHPHTVFPTSFDELLRITGGAPAEVGDVAATLGRLGATDSGEFPSAAGAPVGDADQRFQVGEDERAVPVAQAEHGPRPRAVAAELELVRGQR